jgi:hypothetical protein
MRMVDELSAEPFLRDERRQSHARERLRTFAVGFLAVGLLFGGLLTYRLLGLADCNAAIDVAHSHAVLLTGFGPFRNYTDNPTESIVRMLNESCRAGVCFYSHVLTVDDEGARSVEQLVRQQVLREEGASPRGWDVILHLGFESHARGLKVETMATNMRARASSLTEPQPPAGSCGRARAIVEDGPCLLPTTAPLNKLNLPLLLQGEARGASRACDNSPSCARPPPLPSARSSTFPHPASAPRGDSHTPRPGISGAGP